MTNRVLLELLVQKVSSIEEKQDLIEKKLDTIVNQAAGLTAFEEITNEKLDQISKDVRFI